MTYAIETAALTKIFPPALGWRGLLARRAAGGGPPAVNAVSLQVRQGELFGLLGPNGAGKTTLIKLLSTLIVPTSGWGRVNGYNLSQEIPLKRSIGLATGDERSFYWRLNGQQNLTFFAHLYGLPEAQIPGRIRQVMALVGLEEVGDKRFQTYSTGMRQRLAIARALLPEPRLLFLDEPTRGLDPNSAHQVQAVIRRLNAQGITIFLTTHNLQEAGDLCQRLAIMDRGRIQVSGTVDELRQLLSQGERYSLRVRQPERASAGSHPLPAPPLANVTHAIAGLQVTGVEDAPVPTWRVEFEAPETAAHPNAASPLQTVLDSLHQAGLWVERIDRHPPSLEAIFSHFTRGEGGPQASEAAAPKLEPGMLGQENAPSQPPLINEPTSSPMAGWSALDDPSSDLPTTILASRSNAVSDRPAAIPQAQPDTASSVPNPVSPDPGTPVLTIRKISVPAPGVELSHLPAILPPPSPLRVACAFIRRDLTNETSYRLSFLLQGFNILLSISIFYFVSRLVGASAAPYLSQYGGNYFSFVLVGIAFSEYMGVGLSGFASNLRQAQTTGTLEAMLATPTRLSVIILSSALWDYLWTTLRVLVYLLIGALFLGVDLSQGNYPAALLTLLLSVVVFSSLGILAASFIVVLKRGDPVTWLFQAVSNLLGGAYYPIAVLPVWLQAFSVLLPVTYSLRAMRRALLQGSSFQLLWPDLLALAIFAGLLLPLSLRLFRMAVRRARVEGTLGHY